jgi:hypothetical protein
MPRADKATQATPQETPQETPVAEVMTVPSSFTRAELSSVESFDDALRLLQAQGETIVAAHETELGDGFRLATEEDKRRLIGVPLLLLEWMFYQGDFGDFVSIKVVAQSENGQASKWILNDGSTGICADLRDFTTKTGRTKGLLVRKGLRASDYWINAEKDSPDYGKPLSRTEHRTALANGLKVAPASTFYLDASA